MANNVDKELSQKYCPRFGKIAVEKGYVTSEQVKQAVSEQIDDDMANRPHRLIGRIFLDNGIMTPQQIELVLNELFKTEK
ncbi:MAG: hypothetical protein HY757_06210 [Nitrospirae bacterium]|nr:hypothetical protein [Nitrospirota bacterium]